MRVLPEGARFIVDVVLNNTAAQQKPDEEIVLPLTSGDGKYQNLESEESCDVGLIRLRSYSISLQFMALPLLSSKSK